MVHLTSAKYKNRKNDQDLNDNRFKKNIRNRDRRNIFADDQDRDRLMLYLQPKTLLNAVPESWLLMY